METSNYSEKVCLCTLNRIFGFEPKLGMRLIEHFGSATGVFENLDEVAGVLEYSGKYLVDLGESSAKENLDKNAEELEKLGREGCRFVGINEEAYPNALKDIEDPPLGLYYKGKDAPEDVLNRIPSIAIIGTRDLTEYGRDWCWKIVEEFSRCGIKPMIVSGFALGVDIAAHLAALRYGLPTVGVLPTGIDSVYPHQHRGVAAQVCETPGCALITDYPPETVPLKVNFLRRNRIIAGMTKATILVESKERGGGMMTARLAWSYEREVYALPGRVDDIRSGGCNILIGEKIAEPIYSLKALTESLQLGSAAETQTAGDLAEEIKTRFTSVYGEKAAEEMGIIVYLIKKRRQPTIDEIALQSGLEYQVVRSHASLLELEGIIGIDLLQRCVLRHR